MMEMDLNIKFHFKNNVVLPNRSLNSGYPVNIIWSQFEQFIQWSD